LPARDLVNGATIAPQPMPRADYWHVELAAHDLLLAEGLPAESYLDTGNRRAFDSSGTGGPRRLWRRDACAPLLLSRAAQTRLRARLIARALALGHRLTDDPGLVLLGDDGPLAADRAGDVWRATLPAGRRRLRLISRHAVPAEIYPDGTDPRRLGVAVARIALDGAAIPPADPRRAAGWHRPEPGLHWTDGDALLLYGDPADQPRRLELAIVPLLRYWRSPVGADASRPVSLCWRDHGAATLLDARAR
ncbi:MAG: Hint domain-containing protein, partial [Rhodospirillales bacterium]|nr:Hint domain-containing protein [Rhodospirillales bacterium]